MENWPEEQQIEVRLKQGLPVLGVEVKRGRADRAKTFPGTASTWASCSCAGPGSPAATTTTPAPSASFTDDGWFRTGDMVTIDREGYVQITDRKKDLIKRKGEWISSVDMENAVLAHPGVLEAAVVGRV